MPGISIKKLNTLTIWRIEFVWYRYCFEIWWLTDWEYFENHQKFIWGTKRLVLKLKIGEFWRKGE